MSRLGDLCYDGVSQRGLPPRIAMVRRLFILSSTFVAALTIAWSATPVLAGASTRPLTVGATPSSSDHSKNDRVHTLSAAVSAGASPSLLQSQAGLSEQNAIAHAGSGNPLVTTPADPSIAVGPSNIVEAVNSALEISTRTGSLPPVYMNISTMIQNTSGWDVRYPHVVYDVASGRFILTVLQFNPTLSACGSQVAVMISQSNPGLAWTSRGTINIDPELGGGVELTNVSLGLTSNLLVEFERLRELHDRASGREPDDDHSACRSHLWRAEREQQRVPRVWARRCAARVDLERGNGGV